MSLFRYPALFMKLALCKCKASNPEGILMYFKGFATKQMREDNFQDSPNLGVFHFIIKQYKYLCSNVLRVSRVGSMNNTGYLFLVILLLPFFNVFGQVLISKQSFETAGDSWTPITFSTPPCTNGSDRWDYSTSLSSITPSDGTQFWGIQDLNGNCGGSGFESITLPNVDISTFTNVVFSFDYNVIGYDNGDDIKYELFYDNVSQGQVVVVNGSSNYSTGGWLTETVNVPNTVNSVSVVLYVKQNGGSDYGGLDNVMLIGTGACPPDAEPTVAASNISFSGINCDSYSISWNNGDGGNRIVVISSSPLTGIPSDLTSYAANATFGSGSTISAGEYVVYNGTGNTVTVTGLATGATYYIGVFEYNVSTVNCSENYLTTFFLSGNQATSATCSCPNVETILVNACGPDEGINEYIIFKNGSSNLNVNDIQIQFNSAGTYCNSGCGTKTIIDNPTYTNNLNATAGCNKFAYMDPIPAGTTVILFTGSSPSFNYDFSAMCSGSTVAVLYCNNTNTTGRFSNSSGNKTTTMTWGACSQTVVYDATNITADGDFANFDASGNVSYGNNANCTAIQLPVELVYFTAEESGKSVDLKWQVYSEDDLSHYTVSKSKNGVDYIWVADIEGIGYSNDILNYSLSDNSPFAGMSYYKLEETTYSGTRKTLSVKTVLMEKNDVNLVYTSEGWEIYFNESKNRIIEVYSLTGQIVWKTSSLSNVVTVETKLPQGIYIIKVTAPESFYTIKVWSK